MATMSLITSKKPFWLGSNVDLNSSLHVSQVASKPWSISDAGNPTHPVSWPRLLSGEDGVTCSSHSRH